MTMTAPDTNSGNQQLPKFMGPYGQAPASGQAPRPRAAPGSADLMTQIQDMAHVLTTLGTLCNQNGQADARDCKAAADELVANAKRFLAAFLARKRKELAELDRLSGQVGSDT